MILNRISTFTALFLFTFTVVSAQGIEFFHGSWSEALEKAQSEKKLIFVDAFASWCGPCKRMAKETFPDEEVGEFFNANFVNLKIDMEKPENGEFASKFPVSSYPTLLFIDETGKIVFKEVGAKGVQDLIATGKKALGRNYRSGEYEERYNEGERDPKFLLDYVKSLNAAGKPSLKITNEYLKTQQDLTTEFNLRFLFEGATDADSRVFNLLLKNKALIQPLVGEDVFRRKSEAACRCTVKKAIEYKDEKLLAEAKEKCKESSPEKATAFGYEADMSYYKATKDVKNYLKAMDAYRKAEVKTPAKLHDLVVTLMRTFPNDPKALSKAEDWAADAAKEGNQPEFYMTLAEVYKRQGEKEKARKTAEKVLALLGENGDPLLRMKVNVFMENI